MKAWLITWESTEDVPHNKQVASILSARTGAEDVRKYVERIYVDHEFSLGERVDMARYNRPFPNPYPAQFIRIGRRNIKYEGEIQCGHNPFLRGRLVDNLKVVELEDGNEKLVWDEIPVPDQVRDSEM